MEENISAEPLPTLGICNLCSNNGDIRSLFSKNKNEIVYSDMLFKCFGIDVTSMFLGDIKPMICSECIRKLQDSVTFKKLAETSLRNLEEATVKDVKVEADCYDGSDFQSEDDEALAYIIQEEKKKASQIDGEDVKLPELELSLLSKSCLLTDSDNKLTESELGLLSNPSLLTDMLERGLFPFKYNKKLFKCVNCNHKSKNLDSLKSHFTEHTNISLSAAYENLRDGQFLNDNINFRCKRCMTEVKNYHEMKSHFEDCIKKRSSDSTKLPFNLTKDQLDCLICKKKFLNYMTLNIHMNSHYPNYICENCGKAFASKQRLRGHMRTHEIGEFRCKYCEQIFQKVTQRENHVSKEHKFNARYICRECKCAFNSFYSRQKHLAEAHNEDLRKYKCKACTQSYVTPGHLSSHIRRDHLNERNYKCEKCDLAFYTRNSLKMHMVRHDGERIFNCTICNRSYQRQKTLKEHMRIHSGDKRFVCQYCSRAFTQKCTLKSHLKIHRINKLDGEIENKYEVPIRTIKIGMSPENLTGKNSRPTVLLNF